MPISVSCPGCGQKYRAPDQAAGRTLKCKSCGESIAVPAEEFDPADILLGREDDTSPSRESPQETEEQEDAAQTPPPKKKRPSKPRPARSEPADQPPLTTDEPPFWRRHLHWLLVLAMLPLAASLLSETQEPDLFDRLVQTVSKAPREVQHRFDHAIESEASLDEVLALLPEQRLEGAWLPRTTYAHWGIALLTTVVFLLFFVFLASDGSADPKHVLVVGLLTATVGVGFLLFVQGVASWTEGRIMVGGSIVVVVFYIFKFIAFSYTAASDPENGFFASFAGFTGGVGLCEELIKAVPLFWFPFGAQSKDWRGVFIWGLASGAGFGIAEGILYSTRYYNGISGPGIYVVRFLSCVALHAIWSGAVGITLYLRRDTLAGLSSWSEWIAPVLVVIGVPMILHGLYDTCLKRDMNLAALLVAGISFAWLAFLMSRLYVSDDKQATRDLINEYRRRRVAE